MSEEVSTGATPGRHWTTTLQCSGCHTVIRYVDEAPAWQESGKRKRLAEEADLYLAERDGEVVMSFIRASFCDTSSAEALAQAAADREWILYSPFWDLRSSGFSQRAVSLRTDIDLRCIDCPACGAEVFVEDAVTPTEGES